MHRILYPMLAILTVACGNGKKVGKSVSGDADKKTAIAAPASADSSIERDLIREVGSEANPAADKDEASLKWSEARVDGVQQGNAIQLSEAVPVVQKTNSEQSFTYDIRALGDWNGVVNISARMDGLKKIDPAGKIGVQIKPSTVELKSGQSGEFRITITIAAATAAELAPGASGKFAIVAEPNGGDITKIDVDLKISSCANGEVGRRCL